MIYFFYGAIAYITSALLSYNLTIKNNRPLYYLLGLAASVVANVAWLTLARNTTDDTRILITSLYWDLMLTAIYLVVPLLFFNIALTLTQYVGLGLIIAGVVLTKL